MFRFSHVAVLALALGAGPELVVAQSGGAADSIVVEVAGATHVMTRATLAALPQDTVRGREHDGSMATFVGPTVVSILAHAGANLAGLRGAARLSQYVVVDARDHYHVVFSIAELSPEFLTRHVILALTVDGKPIPAPLGPFRIVAEGELKPARWVHEVTGLRLESAAP